MPTMPSANTMTNSTTINRLAAALVALLLPLILLLGSARLVMTETFLRWEYQRAGFPPDRYGWEAETRLTYAPYGIRYLLQNKDISYLGDLEIAGEAAFTPRELAHMEDVQVFTRAAFLLLRVALGTVLVCGLGLGVRPATRTLLLRGVVRGGVNTLVTAGLLMAVALVSWDFFFDSFHMLFFAEGSWQFYHSDTLIRLYPPQFWFDAALVVGALTLGGALLCVVLPRRWLG